MMKRLITLLLVCVICLTGCSSPEEVAKYEPGVDSLITRYARFIREDHASTPVDEVDDSIRQSTILAFSAFKKIVRDEWELQESGYTEENLLRSYSENVVKEMLTTQAQDIRYEEFIAKHLDIDVLHSDTYKDKVQVAVHFDSNIRPALLVLEYNAEGVLLNAQIW